MIDESNPTYLLFAGPCYYPQGGASDFISAHSTPNEAMASVPAKIKLAGCSIPESVGWAQVVVFDGQRMTAMRSTHVPDSYRPDRTRLKWKDGGF